MEERNYTFDELKIKEKQFNSFLNTTIIMSAKKNYKEEMTTKSSENAILDDENFTNYLHDYMQEEDFANNIIRKIELDDAICELSAIEQAVLFLLYEEDVTQEYASKLLDLYSKTVSKIKKRAINKLKNSFGEDSNYGD